MKKLLFLAVASLALSCTVSASPQPALTFHPEQCAIIYSCQETVQELTEATKQSVHAFEAMNVVIETVYLAKTEDHTIYRLPLVATQRFPLPANERLLPQRSNPRSAPDFTARSNC